MDLDELVDQLTAARRRRDALIWPGGTSDERQAWAEAYALASTECQQAEYALAVARNEPAARHEPGLPAPNSGALLPGLIVSEAPRIVYHLANSLRKAIDEPWPG